jgi:hypothetical protein
MHLMHRKSLVSVRANPVCRAKFWQVALPEGSSASVHLGRRALSLTDFSKVTVECYFIGRMCRGHLDIAPPFLYRKRFHA